MMPGFSFLTDSYSSPSRSIVPGAMFSTVTSAFFSISLAMSSPWGDFRLTVSDFLLTLNWWKYHGSSSGLPGRSRRPGSPRPGFSILTTSAPNQASTSVEVVPASNWVKSTTLTPCRKLRSWVFSLIVVSLRYAPMPVYSLRLPAARCNGFRSTGHLRLRIDSLSDDARLPEARDILQVDRILPAGSLSSRRVGADKRLVDVGTPARPLRQYESAVLG